MKLTKEEKKLLEEVFRKHIADMQGEQYRTEKEFKKHLPAYDTYIQKVRNLYKKLTGETK